MNCGPRETLKAVHEVWLEPVGTPMARDTGSTDTQFSRQGAGAPVCGGLGLVLRGQLDQAGHIHLHRRRAAWQIALDARKSCLGVALTLARHLHATDAQLTGDVLVLASLGSEQHDARELCQAHACAPRANQRHDVDRKEARWTNCTNHIKYGRKSFVSCVFCNSV